MKAQLQLLFCLLFLSLFTQAQDILTITGQILDKKTNVPIAYAHIGIPEKGIGTTSGNNGEFTFKIPVEHSQSKMMISFIGYKTFRKAISQINSPITIYLSQSASKLNEVVVMGESAVEEIVRKAVKRISKNYPTHSTSALAFYRESRTDDSLRYIYLAEGVLNIYKKSYKSKREGNVSLVQGRKINLKNPLDTNLHSGFSSGHMAAHRFDFVQNRTDFIDTRFFPVYKYWIESITTYNDRPVYIIGFDKDEKVDGPQGEVSVESRGRKSGLSKLLNLLKKKKRTIEARMRGKIYIDKESYAFIRAEFEITEEGLKVYDYYPLYAGSWGGNKYVVNYRQLGEKWYFSDALREGTYGGRRGGMYNNEVKITEINTGKAETILYADRMYKGEKFTRMTGQYDDDFWKSYNTTPLSEGLAESVQQLKNIQKAREVFDGNNMATLQLRRDSIQKIKTLEARAKLAEDKGLGFDLGEPGLPKRKKRAYDRAKTMFGLGMLQIQSNPGQMGITYLTEDAQTPESIVSVNEDVKARDFEIVMNWDTDIFFHKNFFVRLGASFDFYNSINKEASLGLGTQINLTKQRPFYIRAIAQYSNFRYARKVGQATNDFGEFKVGKKTFKGDHINLYYGSRNHNLKLSSELSLELNPDRELYIRGTYFYTFHKRQDVWFWERRKLFRKKRHLSVDDERILVNKGDVPFDGSIIGEPVFTISVGVLFK